MTGKKDFKVLEKRLTRLGFTYDHTNSSSQFVYTHPHHADLCVSPGIKDGAAKALLTKVERSLGAWTKGPKRNAAAVKERQATERERQAAELKRLDAERSEIERQKDALLAGAGAHLSAAQIRALEARVREIAIERRGIERLMQAPVVGSHSPDRRAQHQSGGAA